MVAGCSFLPRPAEVAHPETDSLAREMVARLRKTDRQIGTVKQIPSDSSKKPSPGATRLDSVKSIRPGPDSVRSAKPPKPASLSGSDSLPQVPKKEPVSGTPASGEPPLPKASASNAAMLSLAAKDSGAGRGGSVVDSLPRLDPSDRSPDPNAWSELLMAGDTTALRELGVVSRLMHRWYTRPIAPMLSSWPDVWGHVAELSFTRPPDTVSLAGVDQPIQVLDLRGLPGLRKFRASRIGLDKKRLLVLRVGASLEEVDLSQNRLELLEVVADGPSSLRRLDLSGNRLQGLRLDGVAPTVLGAGSRLCSRLLGSGANFRIDRAACRDFPFGVDSLAVLLLDRWGRTSLPGEVADGRQPLVGRMLPRSLPVPRWKVPVVQGCGTSTGEANFWAFGAGGWNGGDHVFVGSFPALFEGKIRAGMTRAEVGAILGRPVRSASGVDAWANEKTPDGRLWLGVRLFYDGAGRLEGAWLRRIPSPCR